jgi:hypothetical protein
MDLYGTLFLRYVLTICILCYVGRLLIAHFPGWKPLKLMKFDPTHIGW